MSTHEAVAGFHLTCVREKSCLVCIQPRTRQLLTGLCHFKQFLTVVSFSSICICGKVTNINPHSCRITADYTEILHAFFIFLQFRIYHTGSCAARRLRTNITDNCCDKRHFHLPVLDSVLQTLARAVLVHAGQSTITVYVNNNSC